jgi:hypothetical protein
MLSRTALLLIAVVCALGQSAPTSYDALKHALTLSDAQLDKLKQNRPTDIARQPEREEASRLQREQLTDAQKTKLTAIAKVTERTKAAASAIDLGLLSEEQWPTNLVCAHFGVDADPAKAFGAEFGLTSKQIEQLSQLWDDAQHPLHGAEPGPPSYEAAVAVLDAAQKAKLTAFENEIQIANEAIELGLLAVLKVGEPLCH